MITNLSDANTRMLGLQSGQLDIAIYIRPESVVVAQSDPDLKVMPAQPGTTMFLYINEHKPVWQDLRMRKALALALPPRAALLKAVLRDQGIAGVGPIPPAVLPCNDLNALPSDPAQAKTLLAEVGYADSDGDGYLDKDDVAIVPLVYPNSSYGVSKHVTGFDQAHPFFMYFLNSKIGLS